MADDHKVEMRDDDAVIPRVKFNDITLELHNLYNAIDYANDQSRGASELLTEIGDRIWELRRELSKATQKGE